MIIIGNDKPQEKMQLIKQCYLCKSTSKCQEKMGDK